jgi:hypothetical protein
VATYLTAWTDYYRTYRREMTAIAEIWTSFRDASGRPHLDARTLGRERELVEAALAAGQADGTLGDFSPRVMAVTLKAALDGLLDQLAVEPALDLDAYREELIALFDRATSPARSTRLRRFRGDLEPRRELAVTAVVSPANRQLGHEQQPPPVLGERVLALADGRMGGPAVTLTTSGGWSGGRVGQYFPVTGFFTRCHGRDPVWGRSGSARRGGPTRR